MKNIKKLDGSFVIEVNGLPYHTKVDDKYYNKALQLFNSKPELFEIEKEKTEEDLAEEKRQHDLAEKQKEIEKLRKYLTDTDYVVIKISEAVISEDKQLINELKNKYADVLNKRDEARDKINELEKEIKDKKEENEKQQEVIEQIQEKDIISIEEACQLPENVNDDQTKITDCTEIVSNEIEIEKEQDEI